MKTPLLVGALMAPFLSFAADPEAAPRAALSDPIVVTATGAASPLSEVLAPTLVIEREEIERAQAGDVAEIIRSVAGFDIERSGGPGQLTQFRVRGGETDHLLLMIDGVRVNPATGAGVFQNLSPEMIERIEIVKGPRSTLYGSDAMTGVVNIITRSGDSGLSGRFRLGAHNTQDASARAAWAGEEGSLSLDVEQTRTDGFPAVETLALDRGYERSSVNLRGATRIRAVDVALRANHASGTNEFVDYNPATFTTDLPASQDFTQEVAALEFGVQPLQAWRSRLTLSRAYDDLESRDSTGRVQTTRPQLEWNNVVSLGDAHRISVGASYAREKAQILADYCSTGVCTFEERRDILSARVQGESAFGAHRVLLATAWTDHDAFGNETTWNAEYGYDLFESTRLIAAAGTGFRAPNAFERFADPFVGGNPDVKSETSRNVELGLRQQLGAHQVLDLRVFRNDTDDLIFFNPLTFTVANLRKFRNEGLDLSYRASFGAYSANLTALWQDPIDRSTDTQLVRRAESSAGLRLARTTTLTSLGLDVIASSSRPDVDFNTFARITTPGFVIYNLTGGLQLSPHTRLEARWENVSDKQYQTVDGYLQERSSGYIGMRFNF